MDLVTAKLIVYPALRKGEELGGHEIAHDAMHHIHPRCLGGRSPHLMLPCNPQMSGTGSGPSAATISKWPRRKQQHWLNKENMRKQRAAAVRVADGADPAAGARNPGLCTFTF